MEENGISTMQEARGVPSHRRQQSFGAVFTDVYDLYEAAEPTKRTSKPA